MRKTSFGITRSALELENLILSNMDIPRTVFHRRMIDYYLKYDGTIHPNLLIKERSNPQYVHKDKMEQIYLDEERETGLMEIVKKYDGKIGISAVLFQALLTYCIVQAPIILGEDIFDKAMNNNKKQDAGKEDNAD